MASLVRFSFCDVSWFLFAVLVVDCSWSSRVRSLEVRCSMSFWVLLMSVLMLFRESFIWACVLAVIFSELCVFGVSFFDAFIDGGEFIADDFGKHVVEF